MARPRVPVRLPFPALVPLFFFLLPATGPADGEERARRVAERVRPRLEERLAGKGLAFGAPVFIRLFKESRELELWMEKAGEFVLFDTWKIQAMDSRDRPGKPGARLGPKEKTGDGIAPEGFYFVGRSRMKPDSAFHLAFNLGYPNAYDRHHGRTGSALMVHGGRVSVGCYAMSDPGIEEIYTLADAALANGQRFFRVHCFPFRLTDERWERLRAEDPEPLRRWFPFWENLKAGFDWFESRRRPPEVTVSGGRYRFAEAE